MAHDELRDICHEARRVLNAVPEKSRKGSARHRDGASLRAAAGGGGRARASLLDKLNVDVQLVGLYLTLLVEGVADCLLAASLRGNAVNGPALSIAVRPTLEVAGQLLWLLEETVTAETRARRYLTWRFADLREQQHLLRQFRSADDLEPAAVEVAAAEQELIDLVTAARWHAAPTKTHGEHVEAAALVDENNRRETLPPITDLVRLVSSTRSIYALLSAPAHGSRFAMYHGLEVTTNASSGDQTATMTALGIEPNLGIGLTALAVDLGVRHVAGWNGIDSSALHERVGVLMQRAGVVGSGS